MAERSAAPLPPAPHPSAVPSAACFPLLRSAATLQRIPAECGLMGQPWHGSQSLWGVIRICWQSASSVGAILHSLFRASLKGKPPFTLSLYSRREAAGACLPLSRSLRNSWLESLIWALTQMICCRWFEIACQDYLQLMELHGTDWWYCCLLCLDFPKVKKESEVHFEEGGKWQKCTKSPNQKKKNPKTKHTKQKSPTNPPQNLLPGKVEGIAEQTQLDFSQHRAYIQEGLGVFCNRLQLRVKILAADSTQLLKGLVIAAVGHCHLLLLWRVNQNNIVSDWPTINWNANQFGETLPDAVFIYLTLLLKMELHRPESLSNVSFWF